MVKMSKICKITLSADILFRWENVGRQRDLSNFWHFHQWIESLFNSIEFLCLNKVNWIDKKTQFIGENVKSEITLSADVLLPFKNVCRQRDLANFWHFHTWIESFFNSNEFLCLYKVNWVEKRLNSWLKMLKICQITLSA